VQLCYIHVYRVWYPRRVRRRRAKSTRQRLWLSSAAHTSIVPVEILEERQVVCKEEKTSIATKK